VNLPTALQALVAVAFLACTHHFTVPGVSVSGTVISHKESVAQALPAYDSRALRMAAYGRSGA
jgi:hypothetical protein